jgi:hypothetical protein
MNLIMKTSLIFFFIVSNLLSMAQKNNPEIILPLHESTIRSVVNIDNNGTGFLVRRRLPADNSRESYYLITNKHMIGTYEPMCKIFTPRNSVDVFLYYKDDSKKFEKFTFPLVDKSGLLDKEVKLHPNMNIDVAAINITKYLADSLDLLSVNVFSEEQLFQINAKYPVPVFGMGSEVLAIGYPAGISSIKTKRPLAKSCIIASDLGNNFDIQELREDCNKHRNFINIEGAFFLIDGLIIGGNSGGPVISKRKNTEFIDINGTHHSVEPLIPYVLGIVSRTIGNTGLTIVVASDEIIKTIDEFY